MSVESDVGNLLRSVEDPEMKISVIELGLIYEIRSEDKDDGTRHEVDMTLTSPGCPIAPELMAASFIEQPSRLKGSVPRMSI